jgi:hypothetical protein
MICMTLMFINFFVFYIYLWFLGSSGVLDIESHVTGSSRCGKSIDVRKEGGLEEN